MIEEIHESSGNIFVDLGFCPEDVAVLQMRADLMGELRTFIKEEGLTQDRAAAKLRITQSRVSDLVRGKWEKFSLEMLITLAARAGMQVQLSIARTQTTRSRKRGEPKSTPVSQVAETRQKYAK